MSSLATTAIATRCPACDGERQRAFPPVATRYTGDAALTYLFCDRCGLVHAGGLPDDREAETVGLTSMRPISREEFLRGTEAKTPVNRHRKEWLDAVLRRHGSAGRGRALEIGGKDGSLARLLKDGGWDVVGVDPDAAFAEWARGLHGIEMLPRRFAPELFRTGEFDLVVAIQLIEHIARPVEFLRGVRTVVGEKALLYLETPDLESVQRRQLHRRHVTIYSEASLCQVLTNAGFEPIEVSHGGPGGLLTFDQLAVIARAVAMPAGPMWSASASFPDAAAAFERALASDWPYVDQARRGLLTRAASRAAGWLRRLAARLRLDPALVALPAEIVEALRAGDVTPGYAKVLLALDDPLAQRRLWKRARVEGWTRARLAEAVAVEARRVPHDAATVPREGRQ